MISVDAVGVEFSGTTLFSNITLMSISLASSIICVCLISVGNDLLGKCKLLLERSHRYRK
jgi:hypothetical protein